ncbi:hypothetical protein FIBSPDRAFT_855572 [Athelia psychrophila]|uniref:Beta-lactamase-like protein n=1 Tax=Athelia psychrophila TaxID=1759441 RepID=A0A166P2N3_9AGAM|nr:hypothetical protein FIBSPDRAFT_855572 [Fibularhizoctonia sp. CBS 109695]
MSDTIIREVAKDVWIFSRPFARFGLFPVGGRSTAIKLRGGGVWVLASTPLDAPTKAKIDELGPVQYIINPDIVHHLYLPEFKKAYPDAKLIGIAETLERTEDKALKFDGVWGKDAPDAKYGFEDDIQHCFFSGFKNKDVAFLHKDSKSLIQADLLFNLPANEQYSRSSFPAFGRMGPASWLHQKAVASLGVDKAAMRRDATTVAGWDFTRIIPCHGDVIENDGNKAWRDAYKAFLD